MFKDLDIYDKAAVIKLGVGGGLRSLRDILLFYDDSVSIKSLELRVDFGNQFNKADFVVPSGSLYGVPMYPMGLRYDIPMLSEMEAHRNQYNIDTERKNRQLYMESNGNPNAYNSGSRATGLYLITPIAHKEYMNYNPNDVGNLYDPVYNSRVRDWLMNHFNDTTKWGNYYDMDDAERQRVIYAKYNWGPGNVNDTIRKYGSDWLSHTPLETRNYVNFIIDKIDAGKYKTNEKYNEFMDSGNSNITYAKGGHIMAYGNPDWDPKNPYHYHTKTGEKIVITPEDWLKHKDLPYFKQVKDAILAEQAAHSGPEYVINPLFSLGLRRVYKGNMGSKYQNYSSFSGNLPQGYSFTPEGLVSDNQGNLYVLKGFRQTPRFTYDDQNPLTFPVLEGKNQGNVTFYPVNMEKTVKPALPISSVMDVDKEHESAIRKAQNQYEYPVTLWDILPNNEGTMWTYNTGDNNTAFFENFSQDSYRDKNGNYHETGGKRAREAYLSSILGRNIELNGPLTNENKNGSINEKTYLEDIITLTPEEFRLVKKKLKNAYNYLNQLEIERTKKNLEEFKLAGILDDGDENVYLNSIQGYNDWINQDNPWLRFGEDRSPKPRRISRKEAEKKAVIEVGPLQVDYILTYGKGGSIHIKPENRGKFTRLKKRTGHSATWFKQHGTPAQKKMATFALNARKWHHKHPDGGPNDTIQTPNLVIDKYIGTKYDPTIWSSRNFLINHNIQENPNALLVGDYFRSYANSEGAQRILNNQSKWYSSYHPIRDRWYGRMIYGNPKSGGKNAINQLSTLDSNGVFDLEDDVRISKHRSNHNHVATFIGVYAPNYGEYRYEDDYEYPEGLVVPHELMHRLNDNVLNGVQSEALNLNRNTVINGHDEFNNEKYGDLQGLKFLLYDNGIYDSRGNKDATADDIEKLRLLYPYLRPLLLMDNEKAAWMINHVVDNSNFRNDYINKIAYGGPIKPFSYLPIPEVRY